jgi:NADH:ubiquinone oxidoreductase subunit F (NADH-binding)
VRYLAGESAGQCGPCRFGLPAIAGQVERLADGYGADLGLLRRWLGQVDGRGGCAHPTDPGTAPPTAPSWSWDPTAATKVTHGGSPSATT